MTIDIVLATYNGASTLPLTLEAFTRLIAPPGGWRLLIVDNGSTDETPTILARYTHHLPVTIVNEPRRGRTRALNTGLCHVEGDLVLFTDDDVIPVEGWLVAYSRAAEANPDVAIFSGQVRNYWMKAPPKWLEQLARDGRSYGGTPVRRKAGPVSYQHIKGANLMIRKDALQQYHFNETLGYGAHGEMLAGDETELCRRILEGGHKARYVPDACIQHIVRRHEARLTSVLRRYFRIGRGIEATGTSQFAPTIPTLLGYPRFLYRTVPSSLISSFWQFLARDRYEGASALIDLAITIGRAYQWKRSQQRCPPSSTAGSQSPSEDERDE